MKHYVLGFMFSPDFNRVALIRKNRPDWQAGKLNGIGGLIQPGEHPHSAMVREFKEETGLQTREPGYEEHIRFSLNTRPLTEKDIFRAYQPPEWKHFGRFGAYHTKVPTGDHWVVELYATTGPLELLATQTDERIDIVSTISIPPLTEKHIENLPWLIAAAIDHLQDGRPKFITAEYPN